MEKLKTQVVWVEKENVDLPDYFKMLTPMRFLDRKPNMILISPEELEARERKIAEDIWEAAVDYEYKSNYGLLPVSVPTKEQYINSLF